MRLTRVDSGTITQQSLTIQFMQKDKQSRPGDGDSNSVRLEPVDLFIWLAQYQKKNSTLAGSPRLFLVLWVVLLGMVNSTANQGRYWTHGIVQFVLARVLHQLIGAPHSYINLLGEKEEPYNYNDLLGKFGNYSRLAERFISLGTANLLPYQTLPGSSHTADLHSSLLY